MGGVGLPDHMDEGRGLCSRGGGLADHMDEGGDGLFEQFNTIL